MRPVSQRHRLLGAVFGVVALALGVDLLTGQPRPTSAAGAAASSLMNGSVELPPDPVDLDALIESLRGERLTHAAPSFDRIERDLFVPTPWMETALRADNPALSVAAELREEPEAKALPFDARHELQGILTGRIPLALIDGVLYRRGAEIDGYRLSELRSDHVVFTRDGSPVILRVVPVADQ